MKKIIAILAVVLLLNACKKQETLAPSIDQIYGPLTVTQPFSASTNTVNFTTGEKVFFNAKFKNDAVWIITITGATSTAVKTIRGVGNTINVDNSSWNGSADQVPSFQVENVSVKLTFGHTSDVFSLAPIALTGPFVQSSAKDVLVSNFVVNKRWYNSGPPCNCKYGYTGPNGWPSDYPNISNTDNSYTKPDGNNYLIMSGTPWANIPGKPVSPYVNFLKIMADSSDFKYGKYFPLYADPEKVYFNIMILGTNTPYSHLQVNIIEEGRNGEDIIRIIDYRPNWTGWKLFSYRYSELAAGSAAMPNPQKVKGIQLLLLSDVPTLPGVDVKVGVDHIIFTHNAPYQP